MSVWVFCRLVHWAVCSLIFQGSVCILDPVLCKLCDFQIFSPVCGLSPHPLNSIINKIESLTSDSLMDHALGTFLRTPSSPKVTKASSMHLLKLVVSGLTLSFHFTSFCQSCDICTKTLPFLPGDVQLSQHHLWKRLTFLH